MNKRENTLAILNYENFDKMPVVEFGYWSETVDKWAAEGHIDRSLAEGYKTRGDESDAHRAIMERLGFDFSWTAMAGMNTWFSENFERKVLKENDDGSCVICDEMGLICMVKPGVDSIPAEIGTTLIGREAWENFYKYRFEKFKERVDLEFFKKIDFGDMPRGLHIGSLMGKIRNMTGVAQLSYLYADDPDLYKEIIDTVGSLALYCTEIAMQSEIKFDFAHYWEDICFKNGPLVIPSVFSELVGPWYKKISELLNKNGVNIISLDCDGLIDSLLPIWLENGVNTMFPIEYGTWEASLTPWRQKYGKRLRGVGGMNKNVFAKDKRAVDDEIERLKPIMQLGGYIPCPDHRIPPDADFALVQYYCDKIQNIRL